MQRSASRLRVAATPLVDIGCNLLDPMFRGTYRGKQQHPDDFDAVLERGWAAGVRQIVITAGSLREAERALALARTDPRLFSTVGVHPTRCSQEFLGEGGGGSSDGKPRFLGDEYMRELVRIARAGKAEGKIVAVGELGLDNDRLQFCPADVQAEWFEKQLVHLAAQVDLPLFLHCRAAGDSMLKILRRHNISRGVVHSFDGDLATMRSICELGLSIGINGCSLRTEENLKVVAEIPADRLLLETDGPWCDIRRTHPGYVYVKTDWPTVGKPKKWAEGKCVKSRQEPCHLRQVLEVCAGVRGVDPDELAHQVYANTMRLFPGLAAMAKATGASTSVGAGAGGSGGGGAVPIAHTDFSWEARGRLCPLGHTRFSWGTATLTTNTDAGAAKMKAVTSGDGSGGHNNDAVQAFSLDDDFDYDAVVLTERKQTAEGWEERSSGKTFGDFVGAAGGEAKLASMLAASVNKMSS